MKGKLALGILAAVLVLGAIGVQSYNGLVQKDIAVTSAWSQVENVLQRRADLIPNLVSTVKGFAKHEKEILDNLAAARAQYTGARSPDEKMKASGAMEGALARLLVVVENYPNLKANESFAKLIDELSGTENRITVERMRYNEAVKTYNTAIRVFPGRIFAGIFNFGPKEFFEAAPEAQAVPKVDFNN